MNNSPETTQSDGLQAPADSQALTPPPTETPATDANGSNSVYADKWADLTDAERRKAADAMEFMGVNGKRARKILRAFGNGKYLRRGVAGAIAWNFEISSLEVADRVLRRAEKFARRKDVAPVDKVGTWKAMGAILNSVARICDSSIAAAEKCDEGERPPVKAPRPQTQIQIGISNNMPLPPVAKLPDRANGGVQTDGAS